ncbi:hypothetical protein C8R43DRAFT_1125049 [Mycena crocata]|nr:hypothetical protein C8R43DRAFT_1125049 [Mycena crocata]
MIQTFIIAAAINPILPSLLTLQPAIYGPMTPASTRIGRVMKASFFNPPFIRVLQIRFKFKFNFKPQTAFKLHPASNCGTSLSSHIVNPSVLPSLCSTSRAFQVLQVQPGGGGSSLRDSFDFELHPALCPEAVGRTLSRNGEVMVAYPQGHFTGPSKSFSKLVLFKSKLSFFYWVGTALQFEKGFIFLRQVRHTQLDFSLHQVHKVQHYPLTVALRCITSSQRGRSRASFLEIQQVHERRNYVYQRRNYGYMSINSFTSSLQALISSSSLFAFHSTQLLNTEWTGCSSLIHATQRLKMIVPSVHIFAGFKLLSFKNAQSLPPPISRVEFRVRASQPTTGPSNTQRIKFPRAG